MAKSCDTYLWEWRQERVYYIKENQRREKMKGLASILVHDKFDNVLNSMEADLLPGMYKEGQPKLHVGAKESIWHIVWLYTNSAVHCIGYSKTWWDYEASIMSLCLCMGEVLK